MTLMKNIALPKRYELWEKLGILPGGAKDEIFNAVVKTSTNLVGSDGHVVTVLTFRYFHR